MVGTHYVGLSCITVNLVGQYMPYYRLLMEAKLTIETILARVVVNFWDDHIIGLIVEVVILSQLDLLNTVQYMWHVMNIGHSTISPENAPAWGS